MTHLIFVDHKKITTFKNTVNVLYLICCATLKSGRGHKRQFNISLEMAPLLFNGSLDTILNKSKLIDP